MTGLIIIIMFKMVFRPVLKLCISQLLLRQLVDDAVDMKPQMLLLIVTVV